jgi:transcriptional regulator with XRE-family HTH domain
MPEEATAKILPLGERLKQHRTARGLSQAQAARELDVARTAYRLWELEAAKPSPDRWRLIARWLGVSISTMLLAEDLIDADGAGAAEDIADRTAGSGELGWDDLASSSPGDFFEQERATIARQTRRGVVTDVESERLTTSLERLQANMQADIDRPPPGTFRKELVGDSHAPELARAALLVTAAGAPGSILDAAELLTSGLVTNSVKRANGGPVWLAITMHPDVLRVEVADGSVAAPERPPAPNEGARWSFMLADALATRWGSGRETGGYLAWFELDLPGDAATDAQRDA